jgi:hypothetical protein
VASSTTLGKIALVTGPSSWADNWFARDGRHIRQGDREAHAQRVEEAAAEAAGLTHELDRLPDDAALLLVGTSGATRLASRWADDHDRLAVVVPARATQAQMAEELAVAIALAMADADRLVKALVCVTGPDDPTVEALRARGLAVRPVAPLFPEPATTDEVGPATPGA